MAGRKKRAQPSGWAERVREVVARSGRPLDELARTLGVRCDRLLRFVRGEASFPPPVAWRPRRPAPSPPPGGACAGSDLPGPATDFVRPGEESRE